MRLDFEPKFEFFKVASISADCVDNVSKKSISKHLVILRYRIMKSRKIIHNFLLLFTAGACVFSLSIVLRIDLMVDLIDSFLVIVLTLGTIIGSSVITVKALFARNVWRMLTGAIVLGALLSGLIVGNKLLMNQFYLATDIVEKAAAEITMVREREGTFPENLASLHAQGFSRFVPVGIFRKRPLYYYVLESNEGFVMGFPFSFWMVAQYDSISGTWVVDD